jgi:hypothetical protein
MNEHKGMRPQDVAILLKIVALGDSSWTGAEVARALHLSAAEVSNSLKRSALAGLIDGTRRRVSRGALLEFLKHGLPYVFPVRPGGVVRGVPTAHAAPPLRVKFAGADAYVWPYAKGQAQGQALAPLYTGAAAAALEDPALYELLALADALRVGRARERSEAEKELAKRLK